MKKTNKKSTNQRRCVRLICRVVWVVVAGFATTALSQSVNVQPGVPPGTGDDLSQPASWQPADALEIQETIDVWLKQIGATPTTIEQVNQLLTDALPTLRSGETMDLIVEAIAIARPDINLVRESLRGTRSASLPPDYSSLLENGEETEFLRNHVRLYLARWLAQNQFYDESLQHLNQIELNQILDRASLLFYRGLMQHQLLKKEDCLTTVGRLLENPQSLPRRFEVLANLMLADLKPLESDSLDEISRIMADIRRRTGLHRSGSLVLGQEEQVIEKLDKLIEQLESQQQSMQASANSTPSSPMQDTQRGGGQGTGDVSNKPVKEGGEWGNLPPAERAAALAELAKDMPPHYRAVIEEYFRQLAKENDR